VPGIAAVTRSTQPPSHFGTHVYDLDWDGKAADTRVVAIHDGVGYGWIDLMKVPVIRGRDFSREFAADSNAVLINETLAHIIGFTDPVGKRLRFFGMQKKIIGVVRDFHLRSLRDPVEPLVLYLAEYTDFGCALVKIQAGKTQEALAGIARVFREMEPAFPFRYYFSDEEYQKLYNSEQTVGALADCFSVLAVFISCLGLLGLTIFTAEQRRKVIGASVGDIVLLLSRDIVKLIVLAGVIAAPLAWAGMSGWLQSYAYRVSVEWWMFGIAGVMALGIALVTISYQAIKAATANPVKGLRVE
jgi:putative ABC transport system permease protein